jgi:hypothetical protein
MKLAGGGRAVATKAMRGLLKRILRRFGKIMGIGIVAGIVRHD